MGLAYAARPQEKQSDVDVRILSNKSLRLIERMSKLHSRVIVLSDKTLKRAFFIAFWDSRRGQYLIATVLGAALAEANPFLAHRFPSCAAAEFTDSQLKLSQVLSHSLIRAR